MSDPNIPASEQAERENLSHLRPDVLRVAAGLAANPAVMTPMYEALSKHDDQKTGLVVVGRTLARLALSIVAGIDQVTNE